MRDTFICTGNVDGLCFCLSCLGLDLVSGKGAVGIVTIVAGITQIKSVNNCIVSARVMKVAQLTSIVMCKTEIKSRGVTGREHCAELLYEYKELTSLINRRP
jgi:hypothetical protein